MVSDSIPEPGTIARIDVDSDDPEPSDCLPPGETSIASASLSPGWIAVTEREFLSYHPDRDPAVIRTMRRNVTGIAVRRAGAQPFLGYVPVATVYAIAAFAVGVLLVTISPSSLVVVPEAPGAGQIETMIQTLGWAGRVLGVALLFSGFLAGLAILTIVGYWLVSRDVVFVFERGSAEPIECPTTRHAGTRAVQTVEDVLSE